MKKLITLGLLFSFALAPFSAFAEMATTTQTQTTTQSQIDEIEAQYLKQLRVIELEKRNNLLKLRQQYEESIRLIDAQLNDSERAIQNEFQADLAQATSTQTVSLREKMNARFAQAKEQFVKAKNGLKETYNKTISALNEKEEDAKRSLKRKWKTFKRNAGRNAEAVLMPAVTALAMFGSGVGALMGKTIAVGAKEFKDVRKNYRSNLLKLGLSIGGGIIGGQVGPIGAATGAVIGYGVGTGLQAAGSAVMNRVKAVGSAIKNRIGLITAGLQEGKGKLLGQIKALDGQAKEIKNRIQALGSGTLSASEHEQLMKQLSFLGKNIAAIALIGPRPVVAYHVANQTTIGHNFIEKAKRKLMAPIQKMTASWRSFKTKMSCLGNISCTVEQRREAASAFLKVYFTIYGLVVAAFYGTILTVLITEMIKDARKSATSYDEPAKEPITYPVTPKPAPQMQPIPKPIEYVAPQPEKLYGPSDIEFVDVEEDVIERDKSRLRHGGPWGGINPFYQGPTFQDEVIEVESAG